MSVSNNDGVINGKQTIMDNAKRNIQEATSKAYVMTTSKKVFLFWSYLGISYYLMLVYIAPALKEIFLTASGSSIILFYGFTAILAFLIGILYSFIMKILLYIFS